LKSIAKDITDLAMSCGAGACRLIRRAGQIIGSGADMPQVRPDPSLTGASDMGRFHYSDSVYQYAGTVVHLQRCAFKLKEFPLH
jgi:hypothetical protein